MGYKTESNERTRQAQLETWTTGWWLPKGKGVGEDEKGKGGQIYDDRRRLDFGW